MNQDRITQILFCPICGEQNLDFIEIYESDGCIGDDEFIKSSHNCNSCDILVYIIQFKKG